MPIPEVMGFNPCLCVCLCQVCHTLKKRVRQSLSRTTVGGCIEGRNREIRPGIPTLNEGQCAGTRAVAFQQLRDPCPKGDHFREHPFANVILRCDESFRWNDSAEDGSDIGDRISAEFLSQKTNRFQLTTSRSSAKFWRNSRQEWCCFFHTLTHPYRRVFHVKNQRRVPLKPCHSRLTSRVGKPGKSVSVETG